MLYLYAAGRNQSVLVDGIVKCKMYKLVIRLFVRLMLRDVRLRSLRVPHHFALKKL